MPAWRRETAGWLSTSSQLGSLPIFRPSVTRVTGSTFRSSRSMTKLLSCVCIRTRGERGRGKGGGVILARSKIPALTPGPFPLPLISSPDGEEDDLDDVDEHQRQHQGGGDDVRREPELEQ